MKILITGINGFVGKHLMRMLNERGYDVYGIDKVSSSNKVFATNICKVTDVIKIIKAIEPNVVYHLAASTFVANRKDWELYQINVNGTLNLLKACINQKRLPRFVFVSSSQVYGNVPVNSQPIVEESPLNPVNHYGASKAMGEMLVKAFSSEYGLEYIIFRPFNHTGPGQSEIFIVPKIVKAFKEKKETLEVGNIESERDFCDVRDVVRAYCLVIENWKNAEVYNVASGNSFSIKEIISIIEDISGRRINVKQKESLFRANEILKIVGSYEKIRHDFGWEPSIPIEQTLLDMLNEKGE